MPIDLRPKQKTTLDVTMGLRMRGKDRETLRTIAQVAGITTGEIIRRIVDDFLKGKESAYRY